MKSNVIVSYLTTHLNRSMQIITMVSIGAFLICEIYDYDVWWHIVIGNDILNRFSVPSSDHFATAALGRHYHDSHWLFQVLMAFSHRIAGMVGVEFVMVGLWTGTLFYSYKAISRWVSPSVSCILLFLAAMASSERFLPRPEIVTYLMIAIFYNRLQEGRYKKPSEILFIAIIQVLWTNSHGLFVMGPFMVGCYWVVEVIRRLRGNISEVSPVSRLLIVLLFATLLTPYGTGNWYYAFLLFTEAGPAAPELLKSVQELSPTFGLAARSAPAFWFYVTILVSVGLTTVLLLFRRHFSHARLIITIGMFVASLGGRRNMALFALIAASFLAENINYLVSKQIKGYRFAIIPAILAMLIWAWFPISGKYYLMMQNPARFGVGVTPSFFPHALPDFLKQIKFSGQVLNSNTLGGFYLYHSYPERLPLTDGRWEVYDRDTFNFIDSALVNPSSWQRLLSVYKIHGILLDHGSREAKVLLPKLHRDPGWRLVYYDHAASFWIRSNLPGLPPAVSLSPDAMLPSDSNRVEDYLILHLFLRFMDSPELEIRNLERALAFDWDTEGILEYIGTLQNKIGRLKEAEKTFQELISKYPDNNTAINELAFIAFNQGDFKKAELLLRRGLERNPDNVDFKVNYEKIKEAMNNSSPKSVEKKY